MKNLSNVFKDEKGYYFWATLERDNDKGALLTLWDSKADFKVYLTEEEISKIKTEPYNND